MCSPCEEVQWGKHSNLWIQQMIYCHNSIVPQGLLVECGLGNDVLWLYWHAILTGACMDLEQLLLIRVIDNTWLIISDATTVLKQNTNKWADVSYSLSVDLISIVHVVDGDDELYAKYTNSAGVWGCIIYKNSIVLQTAIMLFSHLYMLHVHEWYWGVSGDGCLATCSFPSHCANIYHTIKRITTISRSCEVKASSFTIIMKYVRWLGPNQS